MKYYLFILLVFTQLVYRCESSLLPFREHDHSIRKTHDFDDPTNQNDFDEDTLGGRDCSPPEECECLTCNNTLPNPKRVINPYKEQLSNRVPLKPFGSFCIKCAACLAVANEIQKVIQFASEECETDLEKKKMLLQDVESNINNLCENGFKNFDLRSYGDHGIITNNFQCTTHIVSAMDGNWTKKLREICSLYISRVDMEMISLSVLDSLGNLTDTFCRGTGIFRDCANIKTHENITMPLCDGFGC